MATLMQTSPAPANQKRDTRRWTATGSPAQAVAGVSPLGGGRYLCTCGLNELPDFRLNEQAAGMMTKPPYCKKWPKFKMLWPNVAPSRISANTPCIGFL